jgi:molybdopterin synthase catalytic subunit
LNAFSLSRVALAPGALVRSLGDEACGALVTFEGWVRNRNDGRDVVRLEYECYEALAVKEGERILAATLARYDIANARCVHRLGSLALGELAVWVGVSAQHRREAFAACQHIIDEVKKRVPIWKKEFYADGDSGWINCEQVIPGARAR